MSDVDPILLSVFARAFKSMTDEMSISLQKTTRSPILCEAKDFVTGMYDACGNMLEQTENLPILSFSLGPVCKHIVDYFGDDIHPGDVMFHNDVFSMGNQNNDVAVYKPIFHRDRLVAWSACKGHQADIGGAVAGGYNPNATEVWQEALRIPPVKPTSGSISCSTTCAPRSARARSASGACCVCWRNTVSHVSRPIGTRCLKRRGR